MPFAGYPDFAACVADNQDKDDPEGYCAALEQQATGANMTHTALIVPEGTQTSDRRTIQPGALTWRDDIPLMFVDRTTEGHAEAVHVGNATNLRRQTVGGETWIVADVAYDTDEQAQEAMRLADEGKIAGVSADIGGVSAEVEITETDDDGFPSDWLETVTAGEIIGFTQLPMPAFAGAKIMRTDQLETLTAAANPKATKDWFSDPQLPGPTPLTVTDEGRVYGHLATWGTCHIGYDGVCVTAPESKSEYAYFNLGAVNIDGEDIACGHITLGTGHASLSADAESAARHYDDTGSCVADVRAGEDDHGVWVAGAARPGTDIDVLRAASLSGDWRRVNNELELVAALAVNVPGFPIPRLAASVAQGDQLSLVASGVVEHRDREDLIYEALRLLSNKIDALAASAEPKPPPSVTIQNFDSNGDEIERGRIAALLNS